MTTKFLGAMLKMVASEAAGEKKPEAYPLGYVEDFLEPRTKPEAILSIPDIHGIY